MGYYTIDYLIISHRCQLKAFKNEKFGFSVENISHAQQFHAPRDNSADITGISIIEEHSNRQNDRSPFI
jgi:hypothetical protein